ncbi:MAG: SH3 domain-containing protein [Pseudomonadota bacterium]
MIRLFFAFWLLAVPAAAQNFTQLPAVADVVNVREGLELNVRVGPGTQFEAIGRLPRFERALEVTAVTPSWARINFGEGVGWVSRNFVVESPTPQGLSCFGNEPFWSADVVNDGIIWTTPEVRLEDPGATILDGTAGRAMVMTLEGQTTTILITEGQCSDGASDRIYGLNATAVLGRTGVVPGCCSVLPIR